MKLSTTEKIVQSYYDYVRKKAETGESQGELGPWKPKKSSGLGTAGRSGHAGQGAVLEWALPKAGAQALTAGVKWVSSNHFVRAWTQISKQDACSFL